MKIPEFYKNMVIILHKKYVTRNEFYEITNHHHIIYLYPNALYTEAKLR